MPDSGSTENGHPNPRILLVDDERDFRRAIRRQLTVRGYEVLEVDNGKDAIKIVRHETPEVVILDLKMPGMDGLQTLREIKKVPPWLRTRPRSRSPPGSLSEPSP